MARTMRYPLRMTRHFGVLIPSTNTTVEIECRLLPATYQAHIGRLLSSGGSFAPSRDEDIDYQSRLLGTAQAVGRAVRALRARQIAIVSPYSAEVNARAARYFQDAHGLHTVALEGFG